MAAHCLDWPWPMRSFPFVSRDHFAHCIGFSRFCYLFFRCLVLRCGRLFSDYCVFAVYHCKRRFYLWPVSLFGTLCLHFPCHVITR